jgi:hypothetical protein
MRQADRLGADLREAKVGDLALLDQLPHRAGDVFDRHAGVDAVLVEQVDALGSEPAQRPSAGTDTTTTASPSWALLALVLGVGHVRPPMGYALGEGQVRHEVMGRRAVPVFLAVGREDDIAGIKCDDVLPAHLDQAMGFGDVQSLPAIMGMPGAARSGCEADRGDVQLRAHRVWSRDRRCLRRSGGTSCSRPARALVRDE